MLSGSSGDFEVGIYAWPTKFDAGTVVEHLQMLSADAGKWTRKLKCQHMAALPK